MSKFHISKDGVARKCQAKTVESCRATKSDLQEHFETRERAQSAYEKSMSLHTVSALKKKSVIKESILSNESGNADSNDSQYLQSITIKNHMSSNQALKDFTKMSKYLEYRDLNTDEKRFVEDLVDGKIPASFPDSLVGDRIGMGLHGISQDAGYYAKITKQFAKGLKNKMVKDLGDKEPVVLDPLAGKGYFVKAMREQGVQTIGSDNKSWAKAQTDEGIEDLDAVTSLEKYGNDITHLMISWAPMSEKEGGSGVDKKLYDTVQEKFPHITIINIGESAGGCTGSDKFWTQLDEDEDNSKVKVEYDNCDYRTTYGLRDFVSFIKFQ